MEDEGEKEKIEQKKSKSRDERETRDRREKLTPEYRTRNEDGRTLVDYRR